MEMETMHRIGALIAHYFGTERYTDKDGAVWVGKGEDPDKVWIVESGSDEGHMTKNEMMKKMCSELLEGEYSADFDAFEYAVEWTLKGAFEPYPIKPDSWVPRDSAERYLEFNEKMFPDKMVNYTVRLVKRRKAGGIENV